MPSIRNSLLLVGALLTLTSTASPVPARGSDSSPGGSPAQDDTCSGTISISTTTITMPAPTSISTVILPASTLTTTATAILAVSTSSTPTFSNTSSTISTFTTPTTVAKLPSTGTSTDLPSTNLTVKFVAIGRGIQNYSCAAVNATPVSIGAVAVLFDYTSLATTNETLLHILPSTAVNIAFNPFPLDGTPTSLAGLPAATVLGHHYFAADTTPTFNLTGASDGDGGNMILFGAKTASVSAPAGSPLGPDGTGSVAWLQLEAKTGIVAETSIGVSEAYRVKTAGGNPTTLCTSVGTQTVDYAAEYWFFD